MKLIWYSQQITYFLHIANMYNAIHYTSSVVNYTCKVVQQSPMSVQLIAAN
jgi:hypothetical protein